MTAEHEYRRLVERVRARIRDHVPPAARTVVISRGDGTLLDVQGRAAQHFPQTPTGLYAGYHPEDGDAAAAHLEELREGGAEYLVVPATSLWWLEHYEELRLLLEKSATLIVDDRETCLVFRLTADDQPEPPRIVGDAARTVPQVSGLLGALLPRHAGVVLVGEAAGSVDLGDRRVWTIPPPRADTGMSVADALARIQAATGDGARYVVLMHPEPVSEQLDGRLRGELTRAMRAVCAQRLASVFEVA